MNRDHSVIFEIAPKYSISDSFVNYEGYSISSKGFLPTVVDIVVIWIKFACSGSLIPKMLVLIIAISCLTTSKFTCYSKYLLTSYFCIPVHYDEKDIFLGVLVLEGLVGLHRTIQLQLL